MTAMQEREGGKGIQRAVEKAAGDEHTLISLVGDAL
jgi:hypothetical protein